MCLILHGHPEMAFRSVTESAIEIRADEPTEARRVCVSQADSVAGTVFAWRFSLMVGTLPFRQRAPPIPRDAHLPVSTLLVVHGDEPLNEIQLDQSEVHAKA